MDPDLVAVNNDIQANKYPEFNKFVHDLTGATDQKTNFILQHHEKFKLPEFKTSLDETNQFITGKYAEQVKFIINKVLEKKARAKEEAQTAIQQLEERAAAAEAKVQNSVQEKERAEAMVATARSEAEAMAAAANEAAATARSEAEERSAAANEAAVAAKAEAEAMVAAANEAAAAAKAEADITIRDLEANVTRANEQVRDLSEGDAGLRTQIEQLQGEIGKNKTKSGEMIREIEELKKEVERCKAINSLPGSDSKHLNVAAGLGPGRNVTKKNHQALEDVLKKRQETPLQTDAASASLTPVRAAVEAASAPAGEAVKSASLTPTGLITEGLPDLTLASGADSGSASGAPAAVQSGAPAAVQSGAPPSVHVGDPVDQAKPSNKSFVRKELGKNYGGKSKKKYNSKRNKTKKHRK